MAGKKATKPEPVAQPLPDRTGEVVIYNLTPEDAKRLNETRDPSAGKLDAGQRVRLHVDFDHGGDCVDGTLKHEGQELFVERRNRGYGFGQWDFVPQA